MPKPEPTNLPTNAYQHRNRAGDVYYLQSKPDARAKQRCYFARKLTGTPVPVLPEGYEVRENPLSAQVTLRKHRPSRITVDEANLLSEAIRQSCPGLLFIVDREHSALIVYTTDIEAESRLEFLSMIAPINKDRADNLRDFMIGHAQYQAMLKFELQPGEPRRFAPYRWHFSGSIDDWITIGDGPEPLDALAEKFSPHLAQESFFDLM